MVHINKPIQCPKCGMLMENYSINNNTGDIVFTCSCSMSLTLSENDYKKLLEDGKLHVETK